jgi:hypothetical protein
VIIYIKRIDKNGDTLVGITFQHPMMDMLLSIVLRTEKKESTDTANGKTSAE